MIRAEELTGYTGMPFYRLIFGAIHNIPVLNRIIALAFMLLMGYMLIRIGVRYVLLPISSLMPAIFFILVCGSPARDPAGKSGPGWICLLPLLLCHPL